MSDTAPSASAPDGFRALCGSVRWAQMMAAGGPYADQAELQAAATVAFDALDRADWLEAFVAHSDIGAPRPDDATGAGEQAGLAGAGRALRATLARGTAAYRRRFGFPFLICARGRSGEELLAALATRLENSCDAEFATACAQQREITALRISAS